MSKTRITKETGAIRIFDAEAMRRALRRIAHEIIERNRDLTTLILVGIPARGVELARRIAADIEVIEKVGVATGVIDVSMHRDDVGTRTGLPVVRASQLPLPLEQRTVVIVDDVLFTGRTCRAAMDAISSFGRPACIQFFVGKNLPTARAERVRVRLEKVDNEPDGVWLLKPNE